MQQDLDYNGNPVEKTVYVLLTNDRHTDVHVRVYTDRNIALEEAKEYAEMETRNPEEFPVEESVPGYLYFAYYSVEEDYISLEEVHLDQRERIDCE